MAVKKQGLKGAAIGGGVDGMEFSDQKFHPVWAKAEELGVPLFIHPAAMPELKNRLSGNGWLTNTIGNPLETTIALSHLIFEGSFPRIESDRGAWRRVSGVLRRSFGSSLPGWPQKLQPGYQAQEAANGISQADLFRFPDLHTRGDPPQVGAGQVVLGSDYPYPWQLYPVDHIFASTSFSDDEKADIIGRTAAKLFNFQA